MSFTEDPHESWKVKTSKTPDPIRILSEVKSNSPVSDSHSMSMSSPATPKRHLEGDFGQEVEPYLPLDGQPDLANTLKQPSRSPPMPSQSLKVTRFERTKSEMNFIEKDRL